jgi:NAD dependent epimerase/dehydratase family enzyme
LAGENIADGRWSKTKKNRILNSRVKGTKLLAEYFANSNQKPRLIISASAVGFYGDRGAEIVDEDSKAGNGFLANVCVQWKMP